MPSRRLALAVTAAAVTAACFATSCYAPPERRAAPEAKADVSATKPVGEAKAQGPAAGCPEGREEAVRGQLEAMCRARGSIADEALARLTTPTSPAQLDVPTVIRIDVTQSAWAVEGQVVAPDNLVELVRETDAQLRAHHERRGLVMEQGWLLTIYADVPLADVARVLTLLDKAELRTGWFGVAAPFADQRPRPPAPEVAKELFTEMQSLPLEKRSPLIQERVDPLAGQCEAIGAPFAALLTTADSDGCGPVARDLASALAGCGCPDWSDRLLSISFALLIGAEATDFGLVAIPVTLDRAAPPANAAGATTWGDVGATMTTGARRPFWIAG